MLNPLLHIIAAVISMILLMAMISFVVVLFLENNKTGYISSKMESFRKYLCQIMHIIREDWCSLWEGIVYFMFCLIITLGILIVLARNIPLENYSVWNIVEKFFSEHSVIASLVGTLVGLVLTFLLLRPRLILKKAYLYKHINCDNPFDSLSFCIANIGLFPVYNIKVSAFWIRIPTNTKHPNDKSFQREWKTMRIQLFRPEINSINGILSKENNTYSCHAVQSLARNKAERDAANNNLKRHFEDNTLDFFVGEQLFGDTIMCRVQATHGLSGITKVYEWKIDANDIDGYKNIQAIKEELVKKYKLSVKKETGEVELTNLERTEDGQKHLNV